MINLHFGHNCLVSLVSAIQMEDLRICKDLNWKAGHGALAESAKDHFAPILAGPFDDKPSNNHKDKADRQ